MMIAFAFVLAFLGGIVIGGAIMFYLMVSSMPSLWR